MTNKPSPSPQRSAPTPAADPADLTGAGEAADTVDLAADGEAADSDTADLAEAGAEGRHPTVSVDIDSGDFWKAVRVAREEASRESDQPIPVYREYPYGEVSARGEAIYRDQILPRESPPKGVFVAIDIDSGDYEIHERDTTAMNRLVKRRPIAMTFLMRAGYPAAYKHTGIRPGKGRPLPVQHA